MTRFYAEHPEIGRLTLHHLLAENLFPLAGWDHFIEQLRRLAGSSRSREGVDPEMLGHILMAIAVLWPVQARAFYDEKEILPATGRLARELKRAVARRVIEWCRGIPFRGSDRWRHSTSGRLDPRGE
jgi:hypothetical protein